VSETHKNKGIRQLLTTQKARISCCFQTFGSLTDEFPHLIWVCLGPGHQHSFSQHFHSGTEIVLNSSCFFFFFNFLNKKRSYVRNSSNNKKSRWSRASLISRAVPFPPGNRWDFPELRASDGGKRSGERGGSQFGLSFPGEDPHV